MNDSPIKTIKIGPGNDYVQRAIWENTTEKGSVFHTITPSRQYRDENGWHETQRLYTHHLPLSSLADNKAHEFIQDRLNELRAERKNQQQQDEESDKPAPAKKRGQRKSHAEKVKEERGAAAKTK